MEDAYTAVPFLLEVPVPGGAQEDLIPPRIAPQVRSCWPLLLAKLHAELHLPLLHMAHTLDGRDCNQRLQPCVFTIA